MVSQDAMIRQLEMVVSGVLSMDLDTQEKERRLLVSQQVVRKILETHAKKIASNPDGGMSTARYGAEIHGVLTKLAKWPGIVDNPAVRLLRSASLDQVMEAPMPMARGAVLTELRRRNINVHRVYWTALEDLWSKLGLDWIPDMVTIWPMPSIEAANENDEDQEEYAEQLRNAEKQQHVDAFWKNIESFCSEEPVAAESGPKKTEPPPVTAKQSQRVLEIEREWAKERAELEIWKRTVLMPKAAAARQPRPVFKGEQVSRPFQAPLVQVAEARPVQEPATSRPSQDEEASKTGPVAEEALKTDAVVERFPKPSKKQRKPKGEAHKQARNLSVLGNRERDRSHVQTPPKPLPQRREEAREMEPAPTQTSTQPPKESDASPVESTDAVLQAPPLKKSAPTHATEETAVLGSQQSAEEIDFEARLDSIHVDHSEPPFFPPKIVTESFGREFMNEHDRQLSEDDRRELWGETSTGWRGSFTTVLAPDVEWNNLLTVNKHTGEIAIPANSHIDDCIRFFYRFDTRTVDLQLTKSIATTDMAIQLLAHDHWEKFSDWMEMTLLRPGKTQSFWDYCKREEMCMLWNEQVFVGKGQRLSALIANETAASQARWTRRQKLIKLAVSGRAPRRGLIGGGSSHRLGDRE